MTLDLPEMKLRILAEFDDKNTDDVFATLNATLPAPAGTSSELEFYCSALLSLISRDVISLGFGRYGLAPESKLMREESMSLVSKFPEWFTFDESKQYWTLAKGKFGKVAIPIIILTEHGKVKALEVRINHGFRWWDRRS